MRAGKLVPLILIALLAVLGLAGCDWLSSLLGTSIDARLDKLMTDLNSSDRSTVWENFSASTVNRDGAKPASFWSTFDIPGASDTKYALSNKVTSGDTVTADMVGPAAWSVASRTAIFTMIQDGTDWKILEFDLDNTAGVVLKVLKR